MTGQAPAFGRAFQGAGPSNSEAVRGIGVDQAGNVYVTGYFGGTTDFDPGSGVYIANRNGTSGSTSDCGQAGRAICNASAGVVSSETIRTKEDPCVPFI